MSTTADRRLYNKRYRTKHKEAVNAHDRVYYRLHKEKKKEYMHAYHAAHKETRNAYNNLYCKTHRLDCNQARFLRKYGITFEEKQRRVHAQNNKCMICKQPFKDLKSTHLDHAHATGQTRDILCCNCNHLIGNAKENINILKESIKYLQKWKKKLLCK